MRVALRTDVEQLVVLPKLSAGRHIVVAHPSRAALAWLEKGYEQREPKMAFLKVEPKWNNLRDDARFQNLLRRVGFTP